MSSAAVADADASRSRSGFLTPSSDGSLNRSGHGGSGSPETRERKGADSLAMDHLLKPMVTLKPHPPKLHVQPRLLQPLMILPREHLSLSCLDLNDPRGDLPLGRLFESHIKILDLENRMGSSPSVMIARNDLRGTLYAIERLDATLYTACKLGSWNSPEDLAARATVICHERLTRHPPSAGPPKPAALEQATLTTPRTHKEERKKRFAIDAIQSLVRKRPRSRSASAAGEIATGQEAAQTKPTDSASQLPAADVVDTRATAPGGLSLETPGIVAPEADVDPQQAATNIFDNIRSHYFEALYKSKVDRKHRETIPKVISGMKEMVDSSDEARKKRRRSKKMKLGKDGLYPQEDDRIRQWWAANKLELRHDDETDISLEQVKAHASLLRTRETQLQMIVIMEILALEPLKPQDLPADDRLPALPGGGSEAAPEKGVVVSPPPPASKKRNKHNLPVLLDVHADRLTIWQSMASDEQILLQDSQTPTQSSDHQLQQKASSEPLRDFCVDVIVPFYSSRLPQLCDSLSRKLGGPVIVSPPKLKSKSQKRPSERRDQRPGAAARRTALHKRPESLQHALSFEREHRRSVSRGPSQIEDLMRATSASMPSVKREDSDSLRLPPSRGADPAGPAGTREARSSSLSRSNSVTAGADDVKANRKAKIDAELRDAISNLRKPNRSVVGQAMVEADKHRVPAKKVRRGNKPTAMTNNNSGIQVKATPANHRFKDVMGPKVDRERTPPVAFLPRTDEIIPPSSIGPLAPSTVLRNGHMDVFGSSPAGIVGQTPVKRPTATFLRRPVAEEPAIPPSSPIMSQSTAALEPMDSPTVPGSVVRPTMRRCGPLAPEEVTRLADYEEPQTPVKKRLPLESGQQQQQQQQQQQPTKCGGGSIFERLGWDNDDDLDDLQ
ncbi:DNA replication regulator SLD3 [Geosmithia morbida]|uniref:DNA replication regulator SLD3 n=1 Tax=Geosmithia morbida TaxID=1094350 RepID=A0A9P4YVK7_9HYPO|nr:DNA replication regulator SLD3 [Geosmithia morbida]KAF4123906.1 DNA replication regulator SLD3 [Geosmithia morbida]